MQLPKLNGKVDAETVADIIVTHILAEVSNIYGSRVDSKTANSFKKYTEEIIELVKNDCSKQ